MSDLVRQLEDAENRVERLRAAIAGSTCHDLGKHKWKHIGGKNAGCSEDCDCSVSVYECERCGDCDYGDSEDEREKVALCRETRGAP